MIERLAGKVAVVTGGASGIGRAMGERFGREGMNVVLADVEAPALSATVADLRTRSLRVTGVVTDVASYEAVVSLRYQVMERHGAVHLLCNNAGIGAGAEGHLWDHELNDWRWAVNVNLYGVIHGINAFVPAMIAGGEEGHVVNTKAAVVTLTECLYAQLQDAESRIGASVLFPGPHMLRTGLFTSWRNRPPELAKQRPRREPYPTMEDLERRMEAAGVEVSYTPVEEVAERVVVAVRAGDFWIIPPSDRTDDQIRTRADSLLKRENPTYLREVPG